MVVTGMKFVFFFSSRRRHTRYWRDWSSDVCSSDLLEPEPDEIGGAGPPDRLEQRRRALEDPGQAEGDRGDEDGVAADGAGNRHERGARPLRRAGGDDERHDRPRGHDEHEGDEEKGEEELGVEHRGSSDSGSGYFIRLSKLEQVREPSDRRSDCHHSTENWSEAVKAE